MWWQVFNIQMQHLLVEDVNLKYISTAMRKHNVSYVGKLVESAKELVEKPHQLLRTALRCKHRETNDIRKQNAAIVLHI